MIVSGICEVVLAILTREILAYFIKLIWQFDKSMIQPCLMNTEIIHTIRSVTNMENNNLGINQIILSKMDN